jgi:hypothetical protein
MSHLPHTKTPPAPTGGVQKARIHLGTILPQPARLVNRLRSLFAPAPCPHCAAVRQAADQLAEEILAARVLITAYEATAQGWPKGGQR